MKRSGNHVAGEEYYFPGGENEAAMVLNTFARCDEALHILPLRNYPNLLAHIDSALAHMESDPSDPNDSTITSTPAAIGVPVAPTDNIAEGVQVDTHSAEQACDTISMANEEDYDDRTEEDNNNDEGEYVDGNTESDVEEVDVDLSPSTSSGASSFFDMPTYRRFYREMTESARGQSVLTCDLMESFDNWSKAKKIKSGIRMQAGSNASYGFDASFKKEFIESTESVLGSRQIRPDKRHGVPHRRGFRGIKLISVV